MRKRLHNSITVMLWCVSLAATVPFPVFAGICSHVESLKNFAEADKVESSYFDEYFIKEEEGVFYIRSKKRAQLAFPSLEQVMNALERYPEFMPGYKAIKVKRKPNGIILTAIRFRAPFSPFESRFTNQVEIKNHVGLYEQCWQQLEEDDPRVVESYKSAPLVNKGYWRLEKRQNNEVDISYMSVIRPPVPIPAWLYTFVVKSTYSEIFEKIVNRAEQTALTSGTEHSSKQAVKP